MKRTKKIGIGLLLLITVIMNAQSADLNNIIKIGINGGVATPSSNVSGNLGVDVMYQHLVTPGFGLGVSTGYNHFFGKENTVNNITIKNNDLGVVPIAALFRYYPEKMGFYVGTDIGYGILVGDAKVASNTLANRPDGGFYLRPELGWHNPQWNLALQYVKVFTNNNGNMPGQDYNVGALGLSVSYNIPLGP